MPQSVSQSSQLFPLLFAVAKNKMDSGIGLFLYRKICDQISSPPQSKIEYSLTGSKINIPERQLGANNLTGLMCALLVS